MSRLTDRQLQAAIEKSEATAAKHEAAGDKLHAATARGRAHRNREELKRRQQDAPAPTAPAVAEMAQPRDLEPSSDTAWAAVDALAPILAQYGPALTIRALDHALLKMPALPASAAADVADGVRLAQMRRRHTQQKEAAQ